MLRIAICDDEQFYREKIRMLLERYFEKSDLQYELAAFASGEDFLKACENRVKYDIVFMEDDQDLTDEISQLLPMLSNNKAFLGKLVEKLNFLSEKSSIDIQRIYFKGRTTEKIAVNFYLQSNGIIGIDINNYSSISTEISGLIERCLL